MRTYKHTGSKAKTRSSRPTRFGYGIYGITGLSLVTILAMQVFSEDTTAPEDTIEPEDTIVSVSEDVVVENTVDLQSMTKAQLIAHSEKVGIIVRKSWTKSKMIETLSV